MDKQDEERVREIAREEALKCFREESIRKGRQELKDFVKFGKKIQGDVPIDIRKLCEEIYTIQ